jgi:hypothetical protein
MVVLDIKQACLAWDACTTRLHQSVTFNGGIHMPSQNLGSRPRFPLVKISHGRCYYMVLEIMLGTCDSCCSASTTVAAEKGTHTGGADLAFSFGGY